MDFFRMITGGGVKKEMSAEEEELHRAVQDGDLVRVMELLNQKVNPNSGLSGEVSNLMRAIDEQFFDIAQALISHGADVNYHDDLGDTALGCAVLVNSLEMVKLLVSSGVKINSKDRTGRTELFYAERDNKTEIVEFLKSKGGAY